MFNLARSFWVSTSVRCLMLTNGSTLGGLISDVVATGCSCEEVAMGCISCQFSASICSCFSFSRSFRLLKLELACRLGVLTLTGSIPTSNSLSRVSSSSDDKRADDDGISVYSNDFKWRINTKNVVLYVHSA